MQRSDSPPPGDPPPAVAPPTASPGVVAPPADGVAPPADGAPPADAASSRLPTPLDTAATLERGLGFVGRHRRTGTHRSGPAVQARSLHRGLIALAILTVFVVALITAVPGLRSVARMVVHANGAWIAAGVGLETISCVGYVVLFCAIFSDVPRSLAVRLALSELAANSVVSLSGAGGLALGAWVLRGRAMPAETIARRSVLLFLLTSAVNLGAAAVLGILLGIRLLSGSHDVLLTFVPAGASLITIVAVIVAGRRAQRLAGGWASGRRRLRAVLAALGGGVEGSLRELRRPGPPLLGSLAYWLFDALVLCVAYSALHVTPAVGAVLMAYLLGLLANSIPVPGGFGIVEGGLLGALLLYHQGPARVAFAAVLIYRAISLWLPSLVGIAAFASLRRELRRPGSIPVPEVVEERLVAGELG